jgi:hypothetical protein
MMEAGWEGWGVGWDGRVDVAPPRCQASHRRAESSLRTPGARSKKMARPAIERIADKFALQEFFPDPYFPVHGFKGGRPKFDLTEEQRTERRRKQKEDYRRRNGIMPREREPKKDYWTALYIATWGKPPGEPPTPEEYKEREPYFNQWVAENPGRCTLPIDPRVRNELVGFFC